MTSLQQMFLGGASEVFPARSLFVASFSVTVATVLLMVHRMVLRRVSCLAAVHRTAAFALQNGNFQDWG